MTTDVSTLFFDTHSLLTGVARGVWLGHSPGQGPYRFLKPGGSSFYNLQAVELERQQKSGYKGGNQWNQETIVS